MKLQKYGLIWNYITQTQNHVENSEKFEIEFAPTL